MKKGYFLFVVFILLYTCKLYAQQTMSSFKSTNPTNATEAPKPVNKQEVLNQIAQIDSHLSAIETKRNYVLSDPAQKALAIEQGWFEDMKKIEKSLLKKKNELKKLIDN